LVYDDVPSSWPCGYSHPDDYTRYPFERGPKRVITSGNCVRSETAAQTTEAIAGALMEALDRWAADHRVDARTEAGPGSAVTEVPPRPGLWSPWYMRSFEVAAAR
jgi:hypothetical protein